MIELRCSHNLNIKLPTNPSESFGNHVYCMMGFVSQKLGQIIAKIVGYFRNYLQSCLESPTASTTTSLADRSTLASPKGSDIMEQVALHPIHQLGDGGRNSPLDKFTCKLWERAQSSDDHAIQQDVKDFFHHLLPTQVQALKNTQELWKLIDKFELLAIKELSRETLAILAKDDRNNEKLFKLVVGIPDNRDDIIDKFIVVAKPVDAKQSNINIEQKLLEKISLLERDKFSPNKTNNIIDTKKLRDALKSQIAQYKAESAAANANLLPSKPTPPISTPVRKHAAVEITPKRALDRPAALKITWDKDTCEGFLAHKAYQNNNPQDIAIAFHSILTLDKQILGSADFIYYCFIDPVCLEHINNLLNDTTTNHMPKLIALLGQKNINLLWTIEMRGLLNQSAEQAQLQRFTCAVAALSPEQLKTSITNIKFIEMLNRHPKSCAVMLTDDNAIHINQKCFSAITKWINTLVKEDITTDSKMLTPKFKLALNIAKDVCDQTERDALLKSIEMKLTFFNKQDRGIIENAIRNLKADLHH